jgi:hypothetical protein
MTIKAIEYTESPQNAAALIEEYLGRADRGGYFLVNPDAKKLGISALRRRSRLLADKQRKLRLRSPKVRK